MNVGIPLFDTNDVTPPFFNFESFFNGDDNVDEENEGDNNESGNEGNTGPSETPTETEEEENSDLFVPYIPVNSQGGGEYGAATELEVANE